MCLVLVYTTRWNKSFNYIDKRITLCSHHQNQNLMAWNFSGGNYIVSLLSNISTIEISGAQQYQYGPSSLHLCLTFFYFDPIFRNMNETITFRVAGIKEIVPFLQLHAYAYIAIGLLVVIANFPLFIIILSQKAFRYAYLSLAAFSLAGTAYCLNFYMELQEQLFSKFCSNSNYSFKRFLHRANKSIKIGNSRITSRLFETIILYEWIYSMLTYLQLTAV